MRTAFRRVVARRQPVLIDGYEIACEDDDDGGAWALADRHRARRARGGP